MTDTDSPVLELFDENKYADKMSSAIHHSNDLIRRIMNDFSIPFEVARSIYIDLFPPIYELYEPGEDLNELYSRLLPDIKHKVDQFNYRTHREQR